MKRSFQNEIPHLLLVIILLVIMFTAGPFPEPETETVLDESFQSEQVILIPVQVYIVVPVLSIIIYLLLLFLPKFDPLKKNLSAFGSVYETIRLTILLVLTGIYISMVINMKTDVLPLGQATAILSGLALVFCGNLLGKTRQNWFIGIPTPWTLSDRNTWNRTNRFGGKLVILLGAGMILQGWWIPGYTVFALPVGLAIVYIVLLIYSAVVYTEFRKNREVGTNQKPD